MGAGREGGWGRGGRGGAPFDSRKYAVRFRPIQIVLGGGGGGGGGLSAYGRFNLWGVRMYVNFYYKGEGGTPMIMVCDTLA